MDELKAEIVKLEKDMIHEKAKRAALSAVSRLVNTASLRCVLTVCPCMYVFPDDRSYNARLTSIVGVNWRAPTPSCLR